MTETSEAASGIDAVFWGRASAPRWLGVVALAVVLAGGLGVGVDRSPAGVQSGSSHPPGVTRNHALAVAVPGSAAVTQATDRLNAARADVDQVQQRLVVMHLAAYEENTRVLPIAAADTLSRARSSRYADVAVGSLTTRLLDAQHEVASAEQQQEQALAGYFAALATAAEEAQHVPAESGAPATAPATVLVSLAGPSSGTCAGDVACFLPCTRAHESDTAGGYQAVSPDGTYRGAYQFDQTTWNSVAESIGRSDLVGVNPAAARAVDQDTLATALYAMRGNQPWGGRC